MAGTVEAGIHRGKRLSRKTTVDLTLSPSSTKTFEDSDFALSPSPTKSFEDMDGVQTPIKTEVHSEDELQTPAMAKRTRRKDGVQTPTITKIVKLEDDGQVPEMQKTSRLARCTTKKTGGKTSGKAGKGKAKAAKCKHEKSIDIVDQMARRITQQCANVRSASKVIAALRRSVGLPLLGYIFTRSQVEEAWCRCLAFFNEDEVMSSEASSDSSSASDGSRDPKQPCSTKRQKRDMLLLESMALEPEDDLSGEEDVDEEEDMPSTGFSGGAGGGFCLEWPPKEAVVEIDDGYPVDAWANLQADLLPGSTGFNKRCTSVMRQVGVACTLHTELLDTVACPPLQPHQESVAFLLHPKSPISRLLIDHPTGSGKTWEIIRVLDNYFHDPRPKVPIFPKSPVCRNFYVELLRWPNRYRDYFCCVRPADAAVASGCCDWREKRNSMWTLGHFLEEELRHLCYTIREVLEMKNMFYMGLMRPGLRKEFMEEHPGEAMPAGPMRALSYTSAGGSYTSLRDMEDIPRSAMMKIGYTQGCDNVYTNKVVVMDEAHNLVRTKTQYGEQLRCLRDLLVKADNLVLAGFTGTPILNEPEEGRQLLDIIKGCNAPSGDEGYLSSFPMRPQKLFAVSLPRGLPDALLSKQLQQQVVVPVELCGESMRIYDKKRRQGITNRLLAAYCNVCTYFGSFHEGKFGSKEKVMRDPADCCPKLQAIAAEVAAHQEKALVLISKQSGYVVMLELMRRVAACSNPPFTVATIDELTEFNHVSNLRGQKFRVLVADASQCSEGVSFLAVRRVFLSDVPTSPSQMIQQCGRSIRMFGHQGLPEEEQVVVNHMYVANFPKWLQSPLACWVFRLYRHVKDGEGETYAKRMIARLRRVGIHTLKDLKDQIDAFGETKRKSLRPGVVTSSEKQSLELTEIVVFLELAGLWDDTQMQSPPKAHASASSIAAAKQPTRLPQVAGNARFAALAAGSARLAALTSRMVGAPPPRAAAGQGIKKKAGASSNHLIMSVRAAGRTLEDANKAFGALTEATAVLRDVCDKIDRFVPQAEWQEALEVGMGGRRENDCVTGALRAAANSTFKARDGDLKELTPREVKQFLHHLTRAERVMSLSSAFLAVKDLCTQAEVDADGEQIHVEEWKSLMEKGIGGLLQRDAVLTALRDVAPAAYVARDAGGLKELGLSQVKALRDALERQRSSDKMAAAWSPQTLVRAVKDLYNAESLESAIHTLEPNTADEQALQQLAEHQSKFVPALAALREKAIDCELFNNFKEPPVCDDGEDVGEDEEAGMDVEDDVEIAVEGEAQPVTLPEGWKLEWVSQIRGKAKEQYRFVDAVGRKYYSVLELRTAITGGIEAVEKVRQARREARQVEVSEKPAVARIRHGGGGARKKARW